MKEPVVLVFESNEQLVKGFSEHFIKLINLKEGIFNVAFSGGNTPKTWFDDLTKNHVNEIDWNSVHVYWGDERCVPPDAEESNYGMTKKYLLDHIDIPEQNIHRIQGELKPHEAASKYAKELNANFPKDQLPVFDLIMLGLGEDGHTASIFPHQIHLWDADEFCVATTHPISGQHRVSLTGKVINNANLVVFMVTGIPKAEKVKEILHGDPKASGYPAYLVKPINRELYWFLDKASASYLTYD